MTNYRHVVVTVKMERPPYRVAVVVKNESDPDRVVATLEVVSVAVTVAMVISPNREAATVKFPRARMVEITKALGTRRFVVRGLALGRKNGTG